MTNYCKNRKIFKKEANFIIYSYFLFFIFKKVSIKRQISCNFMESDNYIISHITSYVIDVIQLTQFYILEKSISD